MPPGRSWRFGSQFVCGDLIVIPVLFAFGAFAYRAIVRPAMDKPHLIVVFATMGLSIVMQNLALLSMTADLRDVPPLFGGTPLRVGPIYLRVELVLASSSVSR